MWPNPEETENLATFEGEILNGKLHFYAVGVSIKYLEYYFVKIPIN